MGGNSECDIYLLEFNDILWSAVDPTDVINEDRINVPFYICFLINYCLLIVSFFCIYMYTKQNKLYLFMY
jgi:hypothetical protein